MKRTRWLTLCIAAMLMVLFTGCSSSEGTSAEYDPNMPDLEYEIAQSKDLPQKVNEKIFNKQKEQFGFTYRDEDVMYIVFGFGEQPTGGYSIQVAALKDETDKIILEANLLPPGKEEVISPSPSYPVMILKIQDNDKDVSFRLNKPK